MSELVIERHYPATAERVWELWTTAAGIQRWWAPDGFEVTVSRLDLEPGGELLYEMTATGQEQIAFMQSAGMPLSTPARKRFTEVQPHRRLAYTSDVDYVPGVDTYEQLTTVELIPDAYGVRVLMRMQPMHDEVWTQRLVAGRQNELDNLARLIAEGGDG